MEDDISDFTDPTRYDAETKFSGAHDRHIFRTLHAHLPLKKMPENDLTDAFIQSLYVEVPRQGVLLKNIFVVGGPGCFVEGTLVTLADGTLKRIEEFGDHHLQNININVLRTDKKEPTDKAICFHKYENISCYQIITETGKAIECSYNQPFWTIDEKWKQADKMNIEDKIKTIDGTEKIKSIEKIGRRTVYDIETTKHDFIANGFKVHNTGKTTTQRSIGYEIANMYEKGSVQCLEANYLPDALSVIDPKKKVFVISVDDPLREQDARRPSEKRALASTNAFMEIRHIVMRQILRHQAEIFLGKKLDSDTEKFLDAYHDTPKILSKRFPLWVVEVGAVIFTIFGPQTPTVDQRLHMSKIWEIYKGFGSMDQQRRSDIKRELNKFWIEKLGQNEWRWRGLNQIEFMNKAIIKNTMTEEIGWLNLPKTDNVFEYVEAGAKRRQIEIKTETDLLDEWSQWIYENMNLLQPPYSPIEKKETRFMALRNLIRDIYKKNTDPRDFRELSPENQKFLEKGLSGSILVASLDDRIIKIHTLRSSDKEKINLIADRLLTELEKTEMTPNTKNATRIIRHICRKIFPDEEDFLDKKGVWKKIYDQLLYNWHQLYPDGKPLDDEEDEEDFESEEGLDERQEEERRTDVLHRRITAAEGDELEFNITHDEIIDILLRRYPEYRMAAEIYMHGNGVCGRPRMTNREIYELSQMPEDREKYGFDERMVSIDAVKYRRKQFTGLYSQELGYLFEEWISEVIEQGYVIPGVLEDVVEVIHAKRGTTGYPDFIFLHSDESKTITSVKVYDSDRSESLVKSEFNPEIRALMNAKEEGEDARLLILFRNLGIPHMLTYRVYHNTNDVPSIVTFSPSEKGLTKFVKPEEK